MSRADRDESRGAGHRPGLPDPPLPASQRTLGRNLAAPAQPDRRGLVRHL